MYCLKRRVSIKKAVSILISTLFTINSISFAQPVSKDALRGASTAITTQGDIIVRLHIDAENALLDDKALVSAQKIAKDLKSLTNKRIKTLKAAQETPEDPYLWDALDVIDSDIREARKKLYNAVNHTSKSSSSGINVDMQNLKFDFKDEAAFLAGKNGLKHGNQSVRQDAAETLAILCGEKIMLYAGKIIPSLSLKVSSINIWDKVKRAASLSRFDEKRLAQFNVGINEIIDALIEGLKSGSPLIITYAADALYEIDEDIIKERFNDIKTALKKALDNPDPLVEIAARITLSRLTRGEIFLNTKETINTLKGYLDNGAPLIRLYAAAMLLKFDEDMLLLYGIDIEKIMNILMSRDGLKSDELWIKTYALKALLNFDEETIAAYMDKIIDALIGNEGLENSNPWVRGYAAAALKLIEERYGLPAFRAFAKYPAIGSESPDAAKSVTIFARGIDELARKLNRDIFDDLNISCKVLSGNKIGFYSLDTFKAINIEADTRQEESFALAITSVISDNLLSKIDTKNVKSSSTGITVKVDRIHEIPLQLGTKGYNDMLSAHEKNLINFDADYRLFSAMQLALFASIDKALFKKYRDALFYEFKIGLEYTDLYEVLLSATGLAYLAKVDSSIISQYGDDIFPILEKGLQNGISHYRLLSAIGMAGIADADKDIPFGYKDRALLIIEKAKKSDDPQNNPLAKMGFAIINYKQGDLCMVSIQHNRIEEPIVIFAGYNYPQQLKDKLDERILKDLGISCAVLKDGRLRFSATIRKKALQRTAAMADEERLESALTSLVANKLYFNSPASFTKASSSGNNPEIDIQELRQQIFSFTGDLRSTDLLSRVYASRELSRLDKKITPYINRYLSSIELGLKRDMEKAYVEATKPFQEDNSSRWDTYYKLQEEYNIAIIRIISGIIADKDIDLYSKASPAGTRSQLTDRLNRAISKFINKEANEAKPTALRRFKKEMEAIRDDLNKSPYNSVTPDSMIILFKDMIKENRWVVEDAERAVLVSEGLDKIMPADKSKDIKSSITIILDKDDIPHNQRMFLMFLSKLNPYREEFVERLGVNVVLSNDFNPEKDKSEHMVIISSSYIEIDGAEEAHYLNLQSEAIDSEKNFMQVISAIVFAKGLMLFAITKSPDIEKELKSFHKSLTGGRPLSSKMLNDFIEARGKFILLLPKAEPVDDDRFDTLQKISLQAFMAA